MLFRSETIEVLKNHAVLTPEEAKETRVCFDDIFIEIAALCFALLLGKNLNDGSDGPDAKYISTLKDALTSADGMLTYLSITKRPVLYMKRRVYSYADPPPAVRPFESFNRRILSSVLPGKELMFQLATPFLTGQTQITFANLNPDQLEAFSRGLYVQSIDG